MQYWRPALLRYSVAAALTVAGVAVRLTLDAILGRGLPYFTLFPAVLLAAWYGGCGPGIFSSCLATFSALVFILPPVGSIVPANGAQAVGAACSWDSVFC